ncbi:MAG: hypothetical protein L0H74_14320, partial [Brachybacterium sp.]|nr:hypothetical protein [Brachybacterium sp.]
MTVHLAVPAAQSAGPAPPQLITPSARPWVEDVRALMVWDEQPVHRRRVEAGRAQPERKDRHEILWGLGCHVPGLDAPDGAAASPPLEGPAVDAVLSQLVLVSDTGDLHSKIRPPETPPLSTLLKNV